jgi:hypothetical protein
MAAACWARSGTHKAGRSGQLTRVGSRRCDGSRVELRGSERPTASCETARTLAPSRGSTVDSDDTGPAPMARSGHSGPQRVRADPIARPRRTHAVVAGRARGRPGPECARLPRRCARRAAWSYRYGTARHVDLDRGDGGRKCRPSRGPGMGSPVASAALVLLTGMGLVGPGAFNRVERHLDARLRIQTEKVLESVTAVRQRKHGGVQHRSSPQSPPTRAGNSIGPTE